MGMGSHSHKEPHEQYFATPNSQDPDDCDLARDHLGGASMNGLHVVLGGSGAAGSAVVKALRAQGREVRAISRKQPAQFPNGVTWKLADVADPASLRNALDGASVVYHCAQPEYAQWSKEFPTMNTNILTAVESVGAKLVFADNLYMYDSSHGAINETTAQHPVSKKGAIRKQLGEQLLEWHRQGRVEVAIGRGSDYYGPGVHGSSTGADFFQRILDGKPAQWAGRADQLHAFTFIDDFARALVRLGETPWASGKAWVIPTADALTAKGFASLIAEVAGKPDKGVSALPGWAMPLLGLFVPIMRELYDIRYQTEGPFTVDGRVFAKTFGFEPTPHREAIRATIASLQAESLLAHA
jgi:nucleoside-diphosphate-sugar epimerase